MLFLGQCVPRYLRHAIRACGNLCCVLQGVTPLHLVAAYGKAGLAAAIFMHTASPVGGHAPEVTLLFHFCNQFSILSISASRLLCIRVAPVDRFYLGTGYMAQQRLAGFQTAACMQLLALLRVPACLEVM
jgi:hypothetical protein